MGAWIETINNIGDTVLKKSHPVWVRGLKQACRDGLLPACVVAPRVGAWIETLLLCCVNICFAVAPRVGAWIETLEKLDIPLRDFRVAPRVGAWIETDVMKYI